MTLAHEAGLEKNFAIPLSGRPRGWSNTVCPVPAAGPITPQHYSLARFASVASEFLPRWQWLPYSADIRTSKRIPSARQWQAPARLAPRSPHSRTTHSAQEARGYDSFCTPVGVLRLISHF